MHSFLKALMAIAGLAASTIAIAEALPVQNKTIETKSTHAESTAAYPQTGFKPIDDAIVKWVRSEVSGFKREAAPDPQSAAGARTLDIDYEVKRNDATGFAVLFEETTYSGGAHPTHGFVSFNFLLPDGRVIELPEIIDGARGLRRLSALVVADLVKRLSVPGIDIDPDGIRSGGAPEWSNFDVFVAQPDALELTFPPYQVASYADGPQTARIPFSALHGFLRSDWRAPAASFDCAKAAAPVEQTICADAELARLDREMAAAYAQQLAKSSDKDAKEAISARQRDWFGTRNVGCSNEPQPARVACLHGMYRNRLAELNAPQ